jgi:hypothetical protein
MVAFGPYPATYPWGFSSAAPCGVRPGGWPTTHFAVENHFVVERGMKIVIG